VKKGRGQATGRAPDGGVGDRRPRGFGRAGAGRSLGPNGPPVSFCGKERKEQNKNVFPLTLKIAILTNLEAEFGKTPIE